ncbi:hypothetical protein GQ600_7052 [Phytophthora cactorum]|nr:hypothetical protein GQ600_7052 [Phytophthora cactorum]
MSAAQGSVSKLDVLSRFGYEQPDLLIHFANLDLLDRSTQIKHSQLFGSVTVMTSEFLTEQPGFTAAIVEGYSTSMARVVNNMIMI